MLRARKLGFNELVDIVTALQEAFYLDTDEQGTPSSRGLSTHSLASEHD